MERKTTRLAALVKPNTLFVEIDRPKKGEVSTPTGNPGFVVLSAFTASNAKLRSTEALPAAELDRLSDQLLRHSLQLAGVRT